MPSIKEQMQQMNNDYQSFFDSIDNETKQSDQLRSILNGYIFSTLVPTFERITAECEAIGHVNVETITRDDEYQTRYYICDNCGKQMELGPTPQ